MPKPVSPKFKIRVCSTTPFSYCKIVWLAEEPPRYVIAKIIFDIVRVCTSRRNKEFDYCSHCLARFEIVSFCKETL